MRKSKEFQIRVFKKGFHAIKPLQQVRQLAASTANFRFDN